MERFTFGEAAGHMQDKYHMTEDDVCRRVKISPQTYRKYKKDPSTMTIETLRRFCNLFHCSPDFLIEGRDTEEEYKQTIRMIRSALRGGEE